MKNNWLKMYDKFGQVLRMETVINNLANSKSGDGVCVMVVGNGLGAP